MKKTISILSLLLGLLVCVPLLTACGDDDDDDSLKYSLIGTWYSYNYENAPYTELSFFPEDLCYVRKYQSDRTTLKEKDEGTYKVKGNSLKIWWDSDQKKGMGPVGGGFIINGNTLSWGGDFTRK